MNKKEFSILKVVVENKTSPLDPDDLVSIIAEGDKRAVENLIINGFIEEVPRDVAGPRGVRRVVNFYRATEKGLVRFKPFYERWYFSFKTQTAVWIAIFTIFISISGVIFTALTYQDALEENALLNRPYLFIDEASIEEIMNNEVTMHRVTLDVKNAGDSAALHSKMIVSIADEEILPSKIFSEGHIFNPESNTKIWITLNQKSIESIRRSVGNSTQLSIRFFYEDALKNKYCIESKHSIVTVDDTLKLATDESYQCDETDK